MTALRFQTGERHQTSPASLRGSKDRENGCQLTRETDEAVDVVDVALTWKLGQGTGKSCKATTKMTQLYEEEKHGCDKRQKVNKQVNKSSRPFRKKDKNNNNNEREKAHSTSH